MSEKVVAIISQHPSIVAIIEKGKDHAESLAARAEAINEELEASRKILFAEIETQLKELKLVPEDTDFEKWNTKIAVDKDAILMRPLENDKDGIMKHLDELGRLLKSL